MNITINNYIIILYFFTPSMIHMEMLVKFKKKWPYFSSPAFSVKMFYKIRFTIIFVKMGLGSGQQHFGKSNKIVLNLMPDYLVISQFESIFTCKSKDRISFESEKKTKEKRSPPQKSKGSNP